MGEKQSRTPLATPGAAPPVHVVIPHGPVIPPGGADRAQLLRERNEALKARLASLGAGMRA